MRPAALAVTACRLFAGYARGYCKGRYPLANPSGPRSSLTSFTKANNAYAAKGGDFRHPAFRPAGQPSAVQFCSNKIVHAPGHSFGIIQTMLLALPNVGLERMG